MAEIQRDQRQGETTQRTRETRAKSDVEKSPPTQHELQRGSTAERGDILRPGGFDAGNPFSMMHSLRREMDRLFDDFGFGGSLFRSPRFTSELDRTTEEIERALWSPQIEVREREGKLHVSADLPGLSKDDVRIELLENRLTIEGERRTERQDERGGWSERSYGHFYRSIPLPEGINPETASASFENGVLDIAFEAPKRPERKPRQIPIGAKQK